MFEKNFNPGVKSLMRTRIVSVETAAYGRAGKTFRLFCSLLIPLKKEKYHFLSYSVQTTSALY